MSSTLDFLRLFFDDDESICFRALPPRGAKGFSQKADGSINALRNGFLDHLKRLNQDRGVYCVVNSGGHVDSKITRFNAVFVEDDKSTIADQHAKLDASPLLTTARVETARSVHAYWKLHGTVDAEAWRDAQQRLIAFFHGDPSIKNASRVMRAPGFDHIATDGTTRKRVELVQSHPERVYTIAEILAAFPPVPKKQSRGAEQKTSSSSNANGFANWDDLRAELGRKIMQHDTARKNASGNWDCRGICHNGQGDTGLFYDPAKNQAYCNSDCEQSVIFARLDFPQSRRLKHRATDMLTVGSTLELSL